MSSFFLTLEKLSKFRVLLTHLRQGTRRFTRRHPSEVWTKRVPNEGYLKFQITISKEPNLSTTKPLSKLLNPDL